MSNSDGSWERVVADVVIAGQPRVVNHLFRCTENMANAIPEHAHRLETLVNDLCGRKDGWHGRAAKEFEDVVADLAHEIGALSDDLTVLAGQIHGAASQLSEAIAHIPVPLTKTTSWGGWDIDHELPNHTPMDDSLQDPETFKNALVSDYSKDPSNYRDFLKLVTDPITGRTATANDKSYHGVPDAQLPPNLSISNYDQRKLENRLADWYFHNAGIATHWQTELANDYADRRRTLQPAADYRTNYEPDGRPPSRWPQHSAPPIALSTDGTSELAERASISPRSGVYDQLGSSPQEIASESSATPATMPSEYASRLAGYEGSDRSVAPAALLEGRSHHIPTAAAQPLGLVSAGSSISGPGKSPMPPTADAQQALAAQGRNSSESQNRTSGPVGMMPSVGGAQQKREERRTWLTEDEDYWSTPLGPPPVIE